MCVSKIDTVLSYLIKITELRDQLGAIGMKVKDKELMSIVALNGLVPSERHFVQTICARENLPPFAKL
jgi:hypothetical protein